LDLIQGAGLLCFLLAISLKKNKVKTLILTKTTIRQTPAVMTVKYIQIYSGIAKGDSKMEHRYHARVEATVSVIMHTYNGMSVTSLIHNISYSGFLVEVDASNDAERNSIEKSKIVWVEFAEDEFSSTLPALVIRRSDNTIGLMFMAHTPALRPFLNQLKSLDYSAYKIAAN
jgi:hypothetical protein